MKKFNLIIYNRSTYDASIAREGSAHLPKYLLMKVSYLSTKLNIYANNSRTELKQKIMKKELALLFSTLRLRNQAPLFKTSPSKIRQLNIFKKTSHTHTPTTPVAHIDEEK